MHRLWPDSLTLPFCQCASSKGSDETVCMLRRVWALTKNMPYVHPFCACAKAVKALAKLHKCSCASEQWLMKYTVCTPFLCMCESSEGSGETARMLRFVWTLTDKICQNTPILCMCESSKGSGKTACILGLVWALTEKKLPYVRPICACARAVKALTRLHTR